MTASPLLFVVEDNATQREALAGALRAAGRRVREFPSAEAALAGLGEEPVDAVITDYQMPGRDGIAFLREVRARSPATEVVVVTAYGTIDLAVEAMKAGAFHFLAKPVDLEALEAVLGRLEERVRLAREVSDLRARLHERFRDERVVGDGARMQEVLALVHRVAPSQATVLLTGESGTGKELVANLLHELSPRAKGPFVAVNCAALPEGLLESELFGHARGSFTGAVADRRGRFEEASGGTLLLDEIGEMGAAVQAKLLRALQAREVVRVGENRPRAIDVRVVASTNRDLAADVASRRFREDLFYRLNVVAVALPPLRERLEDVPELVEHFVRKYAAREHRPLEGVTREALDALLRYPYPGNVRELENIVERAVVMARGEHVTRADLPAHLFAPVEPAGSLPPEGIPLPEAVEELERRMIRAALQRHGGVVTRAARDLGLGERALRYKIEGLGLRPKDDADSTESSK
jgi:two-component system NtrC family response regulator